jgi:hypothetical protein
LKRNKADNMVYYKQIVKTRTGHECFLFNLNRGGIIYIYFKTTKISNRQFLK